jgi:transposase
MPGHPAEPAPQHPIAQRNSAAQGARNADWLTQTRTRIAERRGRNIATVAVARKLLTYVFYGLRDGRIRALEQTPKAA